jgi:hypothetical protein
MPEFNDAAEPDKKIEKKPPTKMKSTSTKNDEIDKGRTITGSKPDTININPELSRMEAKNVSLINSIYDQVIEKLDRNNTHNREPGTDSLTNTYKLDTPGQTIDTDFKLQFKNPKNDKEAVSRTGNPDRKKIDLVPRMDPERDRKKDSSFFRQQSIVKKVLEAKNPFKKSAWEKMLNKNPKHKESEENAQKAKEALKQNAKDYEDIVNKDKKNMNEITHTLIHRYIDKMISKHPEAMSPLKAKTKKDKMRASALQLALDKDYPKSAIHKPHIIATEEVINEISPELAGKVNRRHEIDGVPYRSSAAYNAVKNAVRKAAGVKKPGPYVLPDVDKVPPGIGMKEDTTSEKDPLQHLEDRLNKAGDTSHNAIDKIMRDVANDFDIKVQDLHDKWVSKYKITPDQYVKEDYKTPVTTGKLASPDHFSAIKDIALNTKNRNLTIKEYSYGPMDPNDEKNNVSFWKDKADMWNTTVEAAKEARCGNCAVFNQSPKVLKMIEDAIGPNGEKVQKEANLGFCELFEFKCAAARTCDAWIMNGPLKEEVNEDLRKWFKDKWVRIDTKGNIIGDCAREPGEGKPKCLPVAKARAMDKDDRASAVRRKRREDPIADRPGKGERPVFVRTEATSWAQNAAIAISMKKRGIEPKDHKEYMKKIKKNEEVVHLEEKNVSSNPELWSRAKTLAKQKFDVYPSAYANGWAAKWYKSKGGKWRVDEETLHEGVVYHLENEIPFCESIFRYGSKKFFETIEEARKLFNEGTINLTGSDLELIRTDIGSFGLYEGKEVPIDLPLTEEENPDHPPLGKPHKGGPKKYYVYVKKPDGGIKKVTFGDSHGAADGSTLPSRINDPVARKSFAARHKCHLQTDRTSAAYWSCNLPRYAKALGLSGGGSFYW